ncbi:alpha/beta hydrolase [Legionella dresdenensis]|uniref:Alpha/beta hydrolase n=1 Tax=Legionella dresdenensis TaxID=450200 RepID=A0ABV8CG05_9GAMM
MITNTLTEVKNFVHAQLCYQLFITPLPIPLEHEYRDFAQRACEYMIEKRTEKLEFNDPRHYVIHHFAQDNPEAKKVLITHGWMSRAAYMVRFIRSLHQQGYDVYALDFPAHGESRGLQLTWIDAVLILRDILNNLGPFHGVIGHSFGGSMLFNLLNLSFQLPEWQLDHMPGGAVLIASPTNMRTPVSSFARWFKLSGRSYSLLRNAIRQRSNTNITHLNFRHFVNHGQVPVLCVHGTNDVSIHPNESITFCRRYQHASLALIPDADHVDVLIDKRVESTVSNFLLNL